MPTIYYNDSFESEGSQRFTIFHELKHYVFEDKDDEDDDLADFFARYFMLIDMAEKYDYNKIGF